MQSLRVVIDAGHDVVGVFTSRDSDAAVHRYAEQHGLTLWPAEWVRDSRAADALRDAGVDLLLNVHSLYIIHPSLLAVPRIGAFNLHPSPLPRLAGLNSISWAIYLGEREHGVTLHHMTAGVDDGPIAYQRTFPIGPDATPVSIMARCAEEGASMLRELLETAAHNPANIPALPQEGSRNEYHGREVPQDGWVDWSKPAVEIERFVRACDYHPFRSPWGHPRSLAGDHEVQFFKASATDGPCAAAPGTVQRGDDGTVRVAAGDGWIVVSRLRIDGARADPEDLLELGAKTGPMTAPARG